MKKYLALPLVVIGILFYSTVVKAAPCQFISETNVVWNAGRIASFNVNIVNNNGCPNGWGTTQGSVLINDTPATITFWGQDGISVNVPSSVEGLANIKVIGNDEIVYGTSQLLVSLKVNSFPSQITSGDPIELTGNFANTPGPGNDINQKNGPNSWPGSVDNLTTNNDHLPLISWTETKIVISSSAYGYSKVGLNTFRVNYGGILSKPFDINMSAPLCTAASWSCSGWDTCASDGTQKRTCEKMGWGSPLNYCEGGTPSPATTQSCTYYPACTADDWLCGDWSSCPSNGVQTRSCSLAKPGGKMGYRPVDCRGGAPSPATSQSCTYIPPAPTCTSNNWICGSWSTCSVFGSQTRTCNKTIACEGGTPPTSQSCTYSYAPACTEDKWECGVWGVCSPQGIQSRSCKKTYDCSSVETASPATSQYCEAPNNPQLQTPSDNLGIVNQDSIIKATVKLICPISTTMASQGSGTVIDSSGIILTNKHVIDGTPGCLVGFINNYDDEPYFGDRQIADIYKISSTDDMALLKLRNPNNISLTAVNISKSSSSYLKLGDQITTYGYPALFGKKITYTSGDFSGTNGNYLKTTAVIEHGNSGGGAYLKNGSYLGIPSAVVKGTLNSMGMVLSINKINSWLNNSPIAYDNGSSNNYSRVSILENIDLNNLGSLGLYVADSTKPKATAMNQSLKNPLAGYILLQVENHGEAWYVNPADGKRYYMADGPTAYEMMRKFGLGITNADLAKLPQEKENKKYPSLYKNLKGKILLQVENHGEAWYINPKSGYRYYMQDGEAAYSLMRFHSLGITNSDLSKIPEGVL